MKNKIFLFVSLLVLTLTAASCSLIGSSGFGGGVPGSGNVQTETRDTGPFESISIEYPGAEVIVQQDNKESVEIDADDNLLPQLSTEVLSGSSPLRIAKPTGIPV